MNKMKRLARAKKKAKANTQKRAEKLNTKARQGRVINLAKKLDKKFAEVKANEKTIDDSIQPEDVPARAANVENKGEACQPTGRDCAPVLP